MRDVLAEYLDDLVAAAPTPCANALDVGCGTGAVVRRLAGIADQVLGIDQAEPMIDVARRRSDGLANVEYRQCDFLASDLPRDHFDFVISVAAVHHMPFAPALTKMADVTRPGGVVAILGLGRDSSVRDYLASLRGYPHFLIWRIVERRNRTPRNPDRMPVIDPTMSYGEIEQAARTVLPGVQYTRHPRFRYSLVWHKPAT